MSKPNYEYFDNEFDTSLAVHLPLIQTLITAFFLENQICLKIIETIFGLYNFYHIIYK